MSYILNFISFLALSCLGNWISCLILRREIVKKIELVIISLPIPTFLTISLLNFDLEKKLKVIFGGSFVDYGIHTSLPGTAALYIYVILIPLIVIPILIMTTFFIFKTFYIIGSPKTKDLYFKKVKQKSLIVGLGFIITAFFIRVLSFLSFLK